MCGIFGVTFRSLTRRQLLEQLLDALRALEYRGYDSAGLAIQTGADPRLHVQKCAGRVEALADLVACTPQPTTSGNDVGVAGVGIAHTRWATHGTASDVNSHPHTDGTGDFAVVHNGIITNHADLRAFLEQQGYEFRSQTDTEVVAVLCAYVAEREPEFNLVSIVRQVTEQLEGAYALLVVSSKAPYEMVATRCGSPLIIGLPPNGMNAVEWLPTRRLPTEAIASASPSPTLSSNYYFSSDAAALAPYAQRVLYMEDGTLAHVRSSGNLVLYEREAGTVPVCTLDLRLEEICKHGYDDFMLKEIMEQPDSVRQTLAGRLASDGTLHLGGMAGKWRYIMKARRLLFFGCGTSYNAALVMQPVFERLANRPVHVELASDFLDRRPPVYRDDVCFFVSQSGETADTLEVLRYCRDEGDALCVGIVNTVGSSIARLTDCGIYLACGKEIGVASTKAYTSQIVALLMLAAQFGRGTDEAVRICRALALVPEQLRETLHTSRKAVHRVTEQLEHEKCSSLLLIGRAQQYATCREGALKIKEVAYVHTEAIAAGELKHGSVALVDASAHMLVVATHDDSERKVHLSLSQMMARNGRPILVTDDQALIDQTGDQCRDCIIVPRAAHPSVQCLINVLPLQLIAYNLAKLRGYDCDKPRGLAKSVTVQ